MKERSHDTYHDRALGFTFTTNVSLTPTFVETAVVLMMHFSYSENC